MKLSFDELMKQKAIHLNIEGLHDDDLDVLYQVIEQSTVLETLNLSHNNLTLTDGKLISAIAKNTTLKELWLSDNNISDEGAKHLADALKNNSTLQKLHVANNNITDEGARYIANMLAVNKTLQEISLGDNNIGDKGAESIANSLTINTGIREIWLGNDITDAGAKKLADALESNHSIKILYLNNNNIGKEVIDRIKAILNDPKRKNENKENGARKRDRQNAENQIKPLPRKRPAEGTSTRQKKQREELTKVKEQLNSALKEKEDALKLVASMKADIIRQEEEIEMKEQEIKSKDTDIVSKDQQIKSALDRIAKRDTDIANKNKQLEQLASINRILSLTGNKDEPANKRTRTEDTPNKPKELTLKLGYEHIHCSICSSKFSTDLDSKDEEIRKFLPVLSASSKTCDHHFCHGCILKQQAAIAEEKRIEAPKWIPCMVCRTMTSFCPSKPKYHRLQIDILKKAKWVDAPKVKEEPTD